MNTLWEWFILCPGVQNIFFLKTRCFSIRLYLEAERHRVMFESEFYDPYFIHVKKVSSELKND